MSTLETVIDGIRKAAVIADPILSFALIALKATGVGGLIATEAVSVIQAAAKSIEKAQSGAMSSDELMERLASIQASMTTNNTTARQILDAADAALSARFPTPT